MSRHRNFHKIDYDEEYDEAIDDSIYGHSVDDSEYGISPSTAEQYLYNPRKDHRESQGSHLSEEIKEEEENLGDECSSTSNLRKGLPPKDEAVLESMLEELRKVVGHGVSEEILVSSILSNNFNYEASLDEVLKRQTEAATKNVPTAPPVSDDSALKPKGRGRQTPTQRKTDRAAQPRRTPRGGAVSKTTVVVRTPTRPAVTGFEPEENGITEPLEGDAKEAIPAPKVSTVKIRDKDVDVVKKYEELRGCENAILSLVVVGHVDAGKSTLMGHLLYLQGDVAQRTMHKYEQESKKVGKQSFMYAWVLDDTEEERSRGVTVDVAQRVFETPRRTVSLLDAPGHRDFIPNMITGAARADAAVLVVDATTGAFETGFDSGGQTREHAILVRSLGVSELAIAINKMDAADWNEGRFRDIESNLKQFLKTVGFKESDTTFVPCSGLSGENLIEKSQLPQLRQWYDGPTLLEVIDQFKVPERGIERPLRLCIGDVYKSQGASVCAAGTLDSGFLQNGDKVMLMPSAEVIAVKSVQAEKRDGGFAFAGDPATVFLTPSASQIIHVGDFLCDPQSPIAATERFEARIVVFNVVTPIIKGSQFDLHYQFVATTCLVHRLVSELNKSSGAVVRDRPRALLKNTSAIVQITMKRPVCIEEYTNFKELGRFMLRKKGVTVAAGMVTQIIN